MIKLPNHKCSLTITHNEHKNCYETVAQHLMQCDYSWQSEEHRQRSINTNELWTMQWYPETPIGFLLAAAPTLQELIGFVNAE